MKKLLKKWFGVSAHTAKAPRKTRLAFEGLETRATPASFAGTVNLSQLAQMNRQPPAAKQSQHQTPPRNRDVSDFVGEAVRASRTVGINLTVFRR